MHYTPFHSIKTSPGTEKQVRIRFPVLWFIFFMVAGSCESEPHGSQGFNEDAATICLYIDARPEEYSKFNRILTEGKMQLTLCAYNPYGEGYTLFLPTNEAVDRFINQNQEYASFEELLQDTSYLKILTRYHTLNRKVRTDEFPYGALTDRTLTGDRLTIGFYTENDNPLIKVNDVASIVYSDLELTNGYIHVISEVLQQAEVSGYDWLQQRSDYSILAEAMEISSIKNRLGSNIYTILAENDSIYHREGIMNVGDLIDRVSTPGIPYTDRDNSFYRFTAYHILFNEYYLNDLYPGNGEYWTLANEPLVINTGLEIRINPGIDTFRIDISEFGDTTVIDYALPVWDASNIRTTTGPVHSITELLAAEPVPE